MWPLLRAMRPTQWVKNVFVLAPIVFTEQLGEPGDAVRVLVAVAAFCCASSAVYLFNDLRDREDDRESPIPLWPGLSHARCSPGIARWSRGSSAPIMRS